MAKNKRAVNVRIIKARGQLERALLKAETPTQLTPEEQYNAGDWIEPPTDLRGFQALVNQSTILPQCIRAYRHNIAGFGIGVRYVDDETETPERAAEFDRLAGILECLTLEDDTKEIFEDVIEARETYGIAYIEVIRNNAGEVTQLDVVRDVPSMRKTKPLDYQDVEYFRRGEPVTRKKRFRKYRQTVGGATVYYKEFGDPRAMDNRTGEYLPEGSPLDAKYQANEILEFAIGTMPYGTIRWIGQVLGVDGSHKAELLNNRYFTNGRHTPLAIIVSGGTLTEDSFAKLQGYMDDIRGEQGQHAFLLLEMESMDSRTDFEVDKKPTVELKDLANILQKDELFQDYMENNRRKVQSAFQLPDLYVAYTTDFNRATSQTAQEVTEEQVFQPERAALAWVLNNKLLNGYGFKYVEAFFKEPNITNPDDLCRMMNVANAAGGLTPNKAKDLLYKSLGETSEDYPEEWGEVPLAKLRAETQKAPLPGNLAPQLEKAIAKARMEHEDGILAVLKEVRRQLAQMGGDSDEDPEAL